MVALSALAPADRHRAVAAGFTEHAAVVRDWSAPTPVTDWTAGDVIAHFAAQMLAGMAEIEDLLRSSGQYGPPVAVADDADPVARLMGFIGRDPAWSGGTRQLA